MKVETLDELKAAIGDWCGKKRHLREAVPSDLRTRAHGPREMGRRLVHLCSPASCRF